MSWKESVHTLVSALTDSPQVALFDVHVGSPVTEAEIAQVHERLGYALDARFLDYFRTCNGLRLRWIELVGDRPADLTSAFFSHHTAGLPCGSINIPPLAALFPATMDYRFNREDDFVPGQEQVPLLGGFCAGALRNQLRPLDDYLQSATDSSFDNVALIADPRFADPVCILTTDYSAALSDCAPLRARAYLDFVVACCGLTRARHHALRSYGSAGNYPLIESLPRPASDPAEFLRYLLDQLPLTRSREIGRAFEALLD